MSFNGPSPTKLPPTQPNGKITTLAVNSLFLHTYLRLF